MERTPRERETLIFDRPEAARRFAERVAERLRRTARPGVKRGRETVAEAVAEEFASHGEAASLTQPWEHTREEHKEVQELVDVAFARDLPAALRQARASAAYPRNIDLLHDVLTGELYAILQQRGLNRQRWDTWPAAAGVLIIVSATLIVFLLLLLAVGY